MFVAGKSTHREPRSTLLLLIAGGGGAEDTT